MRTVVLREPEWDDDDRARAAALLEWEESHCTCGCGQLVEDAYDKANGWIVDHRIDFARQALDRQKRQDRQNAKDDKGNLPEGWEDGRRYYVVKADPEVVRKAREQRPGSRRRKVTADAD